MHTIRRLSPGEATLYRQIRLEALRESPEAFATSYESALKRNDESWIAQAEGSAHGDDRATFLVMDEEPVGMAALYRDAADHTEGELIQMWIAPAYRGSSLAVDLLRHVSNWAAERGIKSVRAEVTEGNTRALRFYERQGFRRIASERSGMVLMMEVSGLRGSDRNV